MKIHTIVLTVCALAFAACASTPKQCCSASASKACPPNDPHCKVPAKAAGKHKH